MYRVLLADDEPSILDSLQNNIPWSEYGLEVAWTASTGRQVYDILDKCNPDIAVLDIQMPGYSGLDLSRLISEKNVQTQIIIISGYAEFSYAQKAIHYGVIGYCLKPLEYDEITKFLLRAIHNLNQYAPTLSADRFLEAIEANEQEKIEDYLCKIGFSDNPCFLAASTGEQPLSLTEGQTFSVGRDQFVYLSKVPWKKKCFPICLKPPVITGAS
ncbi:MAG: response regulator [Lachnospiraceae bacterium]|nr:response regulator [Lachnospiraceae bacterium]